MKVLHVISDLNIGGAQKLVTDILPALRLENINADLLVCSNIDADNDFEKKLLKENVMINHLNINPRNPAVISKLIKYFRKYDIVHVHLFPLLYFSAIASIFSKAKLIYTEHSTYNRRREKKYLRPIEYWVYSRYSKIISISNQTQEALQSWLGENRNVNRFVVIENGVDLSKFICQTDSERENTIIMVSRFVQAKDQMTLIRAMQYVNSDYKLKLVGDGENLDNCKQLAKELNLENRIEFLGACSDVASILKKSKIGVQSSHWEGFGLTAIEMMSSGLPVIASDVDGLKQVVEGAGLIFPKGDHTSLSNNINKLIEDNKYYYQIKKRCCERSLMYDLKFTANKYAELYRSVVYKPH